MAFGLEGIPTARVHTEPHGATVTPGQPTALAAGMCELSRAFFSGNQRELGVHVHLHIHPGSRVRALLVAKMTVGSGQCRSGTPERQTEAGEVAEAAASPVAGDHMPGRWVEGRTYPCTPWTEWGS